MSHVWLDDKPRALINLTTALITLICLPLTESSSGTMLSSSSESSVSYSSVCTSETIASSTKLIPMRGFLDFTVFGCSLSADGNCWISSWSFAGERSEMSFAKSTRDCVLWLVDSGIHGWRKSTRLVLVVSLCPTGRYLSTHYFRLTPSQCHKRNSRKMHTVLWNKVIGSVMGIVLGGPLRCSLHRFNSFTIVPKSCWAYCWTLKVSCLK